MVGCCAVITVVSVGGGGGGILERFVPHVGVGSDVELRTEEDYF